MTVERTWPSADVPVTGVDYDTVVGSEPASLNDEELRQLLVRADLVRARLDAAVASLAGAFDGRGAWAADGARGPVQWLAARTGASPSTCRAEVRLGRELREMPAVDAAARAGRLGRDQVRGLAWARQPGLEEAFARCEAQLVREVEGLSAAGAWRYLRRWVLAMRELLGQDEPDGPAPTDGEGPSRATLSPGLDGRWFGSLDLDAEDGEILATAVDHEIQALWEAGTFGADDGLSVPERRAVALVEVVRRGTRGGDEDGTARPLVLGILRPDGAELSHAGPVRPETVRRLACEGDVVPVVVGDDGVPLAMGRRARIATRHQRRALRLRDRHCAFAGCTAPAPRCVAHHLVEWEHGGPTDLDNLALVCRFHHRRVHEGGFRLAWTDGELRTQRPDGTTVDARPDAAVPRTRRRPVLARG